MLSQRLLEEVKKITYLIYLNNLWLSIAQVRHLQYNRKRKENTRGLVTALAARPVLGLCRSRFFGNIESQLSGELSSHQHRL
jgi:hypothetical protein